MTMAAGQTLTWAGLYYSFPALLLRWEVETGWGKAEIAGAITLAIVLSGLAAPVSGRIIDRGFGPLLMPGAAALGACVLAALSLATALWQFYLGWAVIGLCFAGSLYEPCFVLVTRARGAEAKRGIVAITLIAGFAGTISFPVVHALAESLGWRSAVQVLGAGIMLTAVPLLAVAARMLEAEPGKQQVVAPMPGEVRFLRRGAFWLLGTALALFGIAHSGTLQHLLAILDSAGISSGTAVLVAATIGPMQVLGRIAMIWSERYLSHNGLTLAVFLMMAVAEGFLMLSGAAPYLLMPFALCFGGAAGVMSILRPVLAREILGERNFGAKSGALAMLTLFGAAAAPYLGALLWDVGGYGAMLGMMIGCAALGALLYVLARSVARG